MRKAENLNKNKMNMHRGIVILLICMWMFGASSFGRDPFQVTLTVEPNHVFKTHGPPIVAGKYTFLQNTLITVRWENSPSASRRLRIYSFDPGICVEDPNSIPAYDPIAILELDIPLGSSGGMTSFVLLDNEDLSYWDMSNSSCLPQNRTYSFFAVLIDNGYYDSDYMLSAKVNLGGKELPEDIAYNHPIRQKIVGDITSSSYMFHNKFKFHVMPDWYFDARPENPGILQVAGSFKDLPSNINGVSDLGAIEDQTYEVDPTGQGGFNTEQLLAERHLRIDYYKDSTSAPSQTRIIPMSLDPMGRIPFKLPIITTQNWDRLNSYALISVEEESAFGIPGKPSAGFVKILVSEDPHRLMGPDGVPYKNFLVATAQNVRVSETGQTTSLNLIDDGVVEEGNNSPSGLARVSSYTSDHLSVPIYDNSSSSAGPDHMIWIANVTYDDEYIPAEDEKIKWYLFDISIARHGEDAQNYQRTLSVSGAVFYPFDFHVPFLYVTEETRGWLSLGKYITFDYNSTKYELPVEVSYRRETVFGKSKVSATKKITLFNDSPIREGNVFWDVPSTWTRFSTNLALLEKINAGQLSLNGINVYSDYTDLHFTLTVETQNMDPSQDQVFASFWLINIENSTPFPYFPLPITNEPIDNLIQNGNQNDMTKILHATLDEDGRCVVSGVISLENDALSQSGINLENYELLSRIVVDDGVHSHSSWLGNLNNGGNSLIRLEIRSTDSTIVSANSIDSVMLEGQNIVRDPEGDPLFGFRVQYQSDALPDEVMWVWTTGDKYWNWSSMNWHPINGTPIEELMANVQSPTNPKFSIDINSSEVDIQPGAGAFFQRVQQLFESGYETNINFNFALYQGGEPFVVPSTGQPYYELKNIDLIRSYLNPNIRHYAFENEQSSQEIRLLVGGVMPAPSFIHGFYLDADADLDEGYVRLMKRIGSGVTVVDCYNLLNTAYFAASWSGDRLEVHPTASFYDVFEANGTGLYELELYFDQANCLQNSAQKLTYHILPEAGAGRSFGIRLHYRDPIGSSDASLGYSSKGTPGGSNTTIAFDKMNANGTVVGSGGQFALAMHEVEYTHFEPYGEILPQTNVSSDDDPRFTNHEIDQESNTTYMKGRYQFPMYAKFNRPDPQRDWDWLRPHTLNLYEYVGNDPVNAWDPTGFEWNEEGGNILLAIFDENKDDPERLKKMEKAFQQGQLEALDVAETSYDVISVATTGGAGTVIKNAVKNKVKHEVTKFGARKLKEKMLSNKNALPGNKPPNNKTEIESTVKPNELTDENTYKNVYEEATAHAGQTKQDKEADKDFYNMYKETEKVRTGQAEPKTIWQKIFYFFGNTLSTDDTPTPKPK